MGSDAHWGTEGVVRVTMMRVYGRMQTMNE